MIAQMGLYVKFVASFLSILRLLNNKRNNLKCKIGKKITKLFFVLFIINSTKNLFRMVVFESIL